MDIFSAQPYRISPLAKQEFSEKQRLGHTSDTTAHPFDKPESSEAPENQPDIQRELQQLKSRDREVHAHEAAHIAAGGTLIRGGANFKYQRGPDGINYAVGGDVSIDISKGSDPHKNLQNAGVIQRAALAPANPSATDHAVAAQASQMAAMARIEIARLDQEQRSEHATPEPSSANGAAQYQRLERETDPKAYKLSEYA